MTNLTPLTSKQRQLFETWKLASNTFVSTCDVVENAYQDCKEAGFDPYEYYLE